MCLFMQAHYQFKIREEIIECVTTVTIMKWYAQFLNTSLYQILSSIGP